MKKQNDLERTLLENIEKIYECHKINDKETDFTIQINPFKSSQCNLSIKKLSNMEVIKIFCVINTSLKIQEIMKRATLLERSYTKQIIHKAYSENNKECEISEDFKNISTYGYLSTENIDLKQMHKMISDNILLVKHVVQFLIELDETMNQEVSKIKSSNNKKRV